MTGKSKIFARAIALAFALAFALCTRAYAYEARNYLQNAADIDKLKDSLVMNQKWVQYPAYKDRKGWDALLGDRKQDFIKYGEKYLTYEWKIARASDYLEFGRSGNRSVLEGRYGDNRKALSKLVAAELAEGKGRFLDQIINGSIAFCEMTSWAPAAHISMQKARGFFPDSNEDIIDIIAGETAAELAWTYYFFHKEFDKANPLISKRIFGELDRRVLSNFVRNVDWWWLAKHKSGAKLVNNWNPWCNSNVIQCYMLLENNKEKLATAIYKTIVSVDQFINYVKADGACEEGPSYWGAAAGALFKYLEFLQTATDGKVSIFDNQQVRDMGEYIAYAYIGDGWRVNFADASARSGNTDPRFIFRYGAKVNSQPMMAFAKSLLKESPLKPISDTDLSSLWQNLQTQKALTDYNQDFKIPAAKWYSGTQFCNMYDAQNDIFFAAKGGFNNESHNHNDVGSCLLFYKKSPIIIDVGVGTYSRQTFSSERYSIMTMRSSYHNLPEINGVEQKDGNDYKAIDTKFDESNMTLSMDIAKAYPKKADVKTWQRAYTLKDSALTVSDAYELSAVSGDTKIVFMLPTKPEISPNGAITITSNNNKFSAEYDAKKFTTAVEEIKLDDKALTKTWGKSIYRLTFSPIEKNLKDSFNITFKPINIK